MVSGLDDPGIPVFVALNIFSVLLCALTEWNYGSIDLNISLFFSWINEALCSTPKAFKLFSILNCSDSSAIDAGKIKPEMHTKKTDGKTVGKSGSRLPARVIKAE